jgi:molybdopterin-guanine dinucleotide biosynthesis protein A
MASPKIVSVVIGPMPKSLFDPMPKVTATFDDGVTKDLFSFYPDELSFAEHEFVNKTEAEARQLFHAKDVRYLQS